MTAQRGQREEAAPALTAKPGALRSSGSRGDGRRLPGREHRARLWARTQGRGRVLANAERLFLRESGPFGAPPARRAASPLTFEIRGQQRAIWRSDVFPTRRPGFKSSEFHTETRRSDTDSASSRFPPVKHRCSESLGLSETLCNSVLSTGAGFCTLWVCRNPPTPSGVRAHTSKPPRGFLSLRPPNIGRSGSVPEGRARGGGYGPSFAPVAK